MKLNELNKKQRAAAFKAYDHHMDFINAGDNYKREDRQQYCEEFVQSWKTKKGFLEFLKMIDLL